MQIPNGNPNGKPDVIPGGDRTRDLRLSSRTRLRIATTADFMKYFTFVGTLIECRRAEDWFVSDVAKHNGLARETQGLTKLSSRNLHIDLGWVVHIYTFSSLYLKFSFPRRTKSIFVEIRILMDSRTTRSIRMKPDDIFDIICILYYI